MKLLPTLLLIGAFVFMARRIGSGLGGGPGGGGKVSHNAPSRVSDRVKFAGNVRVRKEHSKSSEQRDGHQCMAAKTPFVNSLLHVHR